MQWYEVLILYFVIAIYVFFLGYNRLKRHEINSKLSFVAMVFLAYFWPVTLVLLILQNLRKEIW